jgi:hypothetical protein
MEGVVSGWEPIKAQLRWRVVCVTRSCVMPVQQKAPATCGLVERECGLSIGVERVQFVGGEGDRLKNRGGIAATIFYKVC